MNRLVIKLKHILWQRKIDYLLLSVIGLQIFFSWFNGEFPNGNFLYFGGDAAYPLNPSWNFHQMLSYMWMDENAGMVNYRMFLFFWYSFFYIFSKVGLSLSIIQKLYLYVNFILPGLSMYYLTSVVYNNCKLSVDGKRVACWIAALFYMFNPAILRFHQLYFFYGTFPFFLAFFIQFLDTNLKDRVKFCLLMFLFSFCFFMYLPGHNVLVLLLLTLLLYSAGYMLYNTQKIKQVLRSMIILGALEGLLSLWVLFPFLHVMFSKGTSLVSQAPAQMFGTWAEWAQYGSAVIRVIAINFQLETGIALYFSPGLIIWIVNIFFAMIAFSALLIKSRSKMVVYFALIAIIGIFINVGPNPPWGWIYQWALNNFVILRGFRTIGHTMTIIALAYSVLIGVVISEIYLKIQGVVISEIYLEIQGIDYFCKTGKKLSRRVVSNVLLLSMIFLILINGWPLVTGAIFNTPSAHPNNVIHEIPTPYYTINSWLNDQDPSQNYRVLALPPSIPVVETPSASVSCDWIWPDGHFSGSNVVPFIISRPVIHTPTAREGSISPIVLLMYNATENSNFRETVELAGLLNVKYILVDSYVRRLGNLPTFRAFVDLNTAEQGDQDPVQVYNNTQLYDITKYSLLNADFETWVAGNPSSWKNPTGKGLQETNIVYSGLSALKLEANSHIFQEEVSFDSKGTYISFSYYLSPLNSSYYDYFGLGLNVYFADGTAIQYTVEPSRFNDSSSCKYIAVPRVSGQWVNVTRNIGDDVYHKYGSYKHIGGMGIQLLNSGDVPPLYFDNIKILSSFEADNFGINPVVSSGKLYLYKIDDEHFFPRVYATSKIILINGSENQLAEFLDINDFTSKKPVLFLSDQLSPSNLRDIQGLKLDESSDVKVAFQQVNPTKYIVHVTTSKPFFLVLSTSFDPEWIAYIDGKGVNTHLKANGYANAWFVNKTGSFDIVLKYKVQDYYHIAIVIGLSALVGCTVYIKEDWIRKLTTKFREIKRESNG